MIMKTKIKVITMLTVLKSCMSANAQVSVNGIKVFSKLAKNEVFEKFGQPDEYKRQDSGDNGVNEWYHYGENFLTFKENYFIEFTVCDKNFVVNLDGLERDVKVGDKLSVLEPLETHYMDWFEKDWYCVCFEDEQVIIKVNNGVITCISFSTDSSTGWYDHEN